MKLYDHQIEGVKFMVKNHGCLNRSEMGTGKTLMCIEAMGQLKEEVKRVLIVCPNSLKYNWVKEFSNSNVEWNPEVLEGTGNAKQARVSKCKDDRKVFVTNYESIEKLSKSLAAFKPDLIIADESHQIKNYKAKKTKALKAIPTKRKWALTGTPILNNPLDIWSQINWISPNTLAPNFFAFRARYAVIFTGAGFPLIKGFKNLEELKEKVDSVSWGVLKKDCLTLPSKTYQTRHVELSPTEAKAYKEMALHMVAEVGDKDVAASTVLVKLLRLTQITSGFIDFEGQRTVLGTSKLNVLKELLEELDGSKVVIWCHFKYEIQIISEMLLKIGKKFFKLVAEDNIQERQAQVDAFQRYHGSAVMLSTAAIGGTGITLTAASYAIYFSNSYSLGERLQSEDRLHRIGQSNKCTYIDLVVPGTIDTHILKVIQNKKGMANYFSGSDIRNIVFDM